MTMYFLYTSYFTLFPSVSFPSCIYPVSFLSLSTLYLISNLYPSCRRGCIFEKPMQARSQTQEILAMRQMHLPLQHTSSSLVYPISFLPMSNPCHEAITPTTALPSWFKLHGCFGLSCIHSLFIHLVSNVYPSKEGYLAIHFYYRVLSCFIVIFDSEVKRNNPVVFTTADKIAKKKRKLRGKVVCCYFRYQIISISELKSQTFFIYI